MLSEEEINRYIDSIGIYSKEEKQALFNRYLKLNDDYKCIVENYLLTEKFEDFSVEDVLFSEVLKALKNNIIASLTTMQDLKENPVLWDFILGGINVTKKKEESRKR